MFDVFFLGFYVIWGRVLEPFHQVWKMHQLEILRPRGDLDYHEIHVAGVLDEIVVCNLQPPCDHRARPGRKLHDLCTLHCNCPLHIC